MMEKLRFGIDLGGTKTEIAALDEAGALLLRNRTPTPRGYGEILANLAGLLAKAEQELGGRGTLGIGIPGAISPASGRVKNASLLALNGQNLASDLAGLLGREVKIQNDANCFALSEAIDGAGAGAGSVFGVILGTGCGGGVVVQRRVLAGRHRIAGEWGHTPLPWMTAEEYPGLPCWCGRRGCLETYLSGPGLARDCFGGAARQAEVVVARAAAGDAAAAAALTRHAARLARGLAVVVDMLDPDAIVLGGGLSQLDHLYEQVPALMAAHVFSDVCTTPILRNRWGDSSGVRGAAMLWDNPAGLAQSARA